MLNCRPWASSEKSPCGQTTLLGELLESPGAHLGAHHSEEGMMTESHSIRPEQERIQKMQALSGLAIWEVDLVAHKAEWSKRFCLYLGWPQCEAEMNVDWLRGHIHPGDLQVIYSAPRPDL